MVVSKNVVTVFDDMVTTIRKAQKDEYLYEITCNEYATTDLSDEKIIYVVANEKLHVNRKKKNKSRNIYCKGDFIEK